MPAGNRVSHLQIGFLFEKSVLQRILQLDHIFIQHKALFVPELGDVTPHKAGARPPKSHPCSVTEHAVSFGYHIPFMFP